MADDLFSAMKVSSLGMKVQGQRVRVLSENIANSDTAGQTPGSDPYQRQTISFKNELNRKLDVKEVSVNEIGVDDKTPFRLKFMPGHPAADGNGYVKLPNVNTMIEIMDVREAQRSYEANLGMIEQSRSMVMRTIELLRN